MPLLQPNFAPSRKDLRWFAALWWPLLAAALGFMLLRKFHQPAAAVVILALGAILALLGVVSPPIIRPVYIGLIRLTYPIGWCISHTVLAVMYYLVVTPIGSLVRRFHDPMERRFERAARSYWVPREASERARYFRQL